MSEIHLPGTRFILLGEDDIDDEELLRETFSAVDNRYEIQFVNNGRKLVEELEALPANNMPCLLVLDYNMPELNGAEILAILARDTKYKNIPKIIWSTSGSDTYKRNCIDLGASAYLIKPSRMQELEETARYMLSFC